MPISYPLVSSCSCDVIMWLSLSCVLCCFSVYIDVKHSVTQCTVVLVRDSIRVIGCHNKCLWLAGLQCCSDQAQNSVFCLPYGIVVCDCLAVRALVRGLLGFTGTWRGHRVTIHGSGMGMPSLSIYVNELIRDYGAKTLVRIGSCGGMQPQVKVRDVLRYCATWMRGKK